MSGEIKRATGLLVIEVVNSNPNGDPDRESDPRQRPNGLGEISPVSFKRKLRDLVEDGGSPAFKAACDKLNLLDSDDKDPNFKSDFNKFKLQANFQILESRGRDRKGIQDEMAKDIEGHPAHFLDSVFAKKYWDARLFGNTFLEKYADKGYIKTGVVQFGVGVSISPVNIIRHTNTNKAGVETGKDQGMAPLAFRVVEHGVYCMPFFVNPNFASKSGCTEQDVALMKALIPYAYDQTKSAIRPDVRLRHAWYIEHNNSLGSCPDYLLFEALTPKRKGNSKDASESWMDYEDASALPDSLNGKVTCVDLVSTAYV
jgi:Cas7 group CRISPR-associated protein Csh2